MRTTWLIPYRDDPRNRKLARIAGPIALVELIVIMFSAMATPMDAPSANPGISIAIETGAAIGLLILGVRGSIGCKHRHVGPAALIGLNTLVLIFLAWAIVQILLLGY